MTKTKKETPVTAVKNEDSEVTHSKEEMFDVLDKLAKHVQELRDEVAGEEKPSITVFTILCNENTCEVASNIYGSSSDLMDLLVSVARRDENLMGMLAAAAFIA